MNFALEADAVTPDAVLPAWAEASQAVGTLRIASHGYATDSADDPADTLFEPRLLSDVTLSQDVLGGLGIGGVAAVTVGLIDLADGDQFAADLSRYALADGRAAEVYSVPVLDAAATDYGTPLRDADLWWSGTMRRVERARGRRARLSLSDITERLSAPLQPTVYGGTGGTDGGADLEGRPKPVLIGRVFNVAPVYLGAIDLGVGSLATYQLSWRGIEAIDAVRIRGAAQIASGGTPGVGEYRAWLSTGLMQLGATPDGDVTVDARGDNAGSYPDTTATALWRALTALGPQLVEADRDLASWLLADADMPHSVGAYQGAAVTTALEFAQRFLAGTGAILAGGRAGTLRLVDPFAVIDTLQFDILGEWLVTEPEPIELPSALIPPPREIRVEWGRAGAVVATPATATDATVRDRVAGGETPSAAFSSALIAGRVATHRTLTLPGLFWDVVGAQARADKIGAWIEDGPTVWRIVTDRYLGQIEIGHMGRFAWPGQGLAAGFTGIVIGWRESLCGRRLELTIVGTGA